MDFNQILSLLQASAQQHEVQSNLTPQQQQQQPAAPAPSAAQSFQIPAGINLSAIDPDVIAQVRQEYWSQQQQQQQRESTPAAVEQAQPDTLDNLLDSIRGATSVTSEVLVALGRMAKETDLLQVLRECKRKQDEKERALFNRRQEIQERHKKKRDVLFAKELVGVKVDWKAMEDEAAEELRKMDLHVLREMDKEIRIQQETLSKLRVPFFKVSSDPGDVKMQHKILSILLDIVNE